MFVKEVLVDRKPTRVSTESASVYITSGSYAESHDSASSHIDVTPAASPEIASDKQADALSGFGFVRSE